MDLKEVSANQNRHPWELSRMKCIFNEIKNCGKITSVLDIGCGDAYFDRQLLQAFPEIKELYGVDTALAEPYANKNSGGCWVNSLEAVPRKKFSLILMMDVLEHIEDDKGYMAMIQDYLADDGTLILTVPAFQKLFSLHDTELGHYRRYNMETLAQALEMSSLKIAEKSYFYFCLIFLRLLTMKKTQNLSMWHYDARSWKTRFVIFVLNTDYKILRLLSSLHIHLPGLSLLAIIKKQND